MECFSFLFRLSFYWRNTAPNISNYWNSNFYYRVACLIYSSCNFVSFFFFFIMYYLSFVSRKIFVFLYIEILHYLSWFIKELVINWFINCSCLDVTRIHRYHRFGRFLIWKFLRRKKLKLSQKFYYTVRSSNQFLSTMILISIRNFLEIMILNAGKDKNMLFLKMINFAKNKN